MTNRELKPCRFCGNTKIRRLNNILVPLMGSEMADMYCDQCGAKAPKKTWNSVPPIAGSAVDELGAQIRNLLAEARRDEWSNEYFIDRVCKAVDATPAPIAGEQARSGWDMFYDPKPSDILGEQAQCERCKSLEIDLGLMTIDRDGFKRAEQSCSSQFDKVAAERDQLRARVGELEEVLRGVIAEADRDTDPFIRARNLLAQSQRGEG